MERNPAIASAQRLDDCSTKSAVSLLFEPGKRPRSREIRSLATQSGHFALSLDPARGPGGASEADPGWLELLTSGLTFDLRGLEPAAPSFAPPQAYIYGLPATFAGEEYEAVLLMPGPHLAAGRAMFPVVRCMALLAARLVDLPNVRAVAWHCARALSAPDHFRDGVQRWIEGGAFPGLGLTALFPTTDGGLQSEGLSLFTGQEMRLSPELVFDRQEGTKIALRVIHWLVENGTIREPQEVTGPSGEILRLEPQPDQSIICVCRVRN